MKWTGRFVGYSASSFRKDVISGLIVGIIAIPLGMAFAIAAGVKPEYGIYTTIVAGICISLFGGSRYQIGGPTGAFIPILLAIVVQYGYENLLIAGFMAGIILVLMGLFKLGALIRFIPRPVTIGFTSGIAVVIFGGQLSGFLGLTGLKQHESFLLNVKEVALHLHQANIYSMITAAVCFACLLATARFLPKIPASLIGIIVSTLVAAWLFKGETATIGSAFGQISGSLPRLQWPDLTWERIGMLLPSAFIIAMLGSIESLLSAVVADQMTGTRHNSNRELVGQGIANLVTPLFGGIPATGAIARTAANIKNGAVSPLSGVVHGVFVLLVLLFLAPLASRVPLASMAPVLMVVAWNMSERKSFLHILKTKTSDSLVLVCTFALTILVNLTVAVEIGLALAVILFVKRMSGMLTVAKVLPDHDEKHEKVRSHIVAANHDCPQISIYTIEGPLFFGAAGSFEQMLASRVEDKPGVVLLRMSKVPFIDTTGEANLTDIVKKLQQNGSLVLVSGIQPQPQRLLQATGLYGRIGAARFFTHTGDAINEALAHLNSGKCLGCRQFAFRECAALSTSGVLPQGCRPPAREPQSVAQAADNSYSQRA